MLEILIPVILMQLILALYCLIRLAYLGFPMQKYMLWNAIIIFVFFIGGIVFLIKYYKQSIKAQLEQLGVNTSNNAVGMFKDEPDTEPEITE